MRRRVLGIIYTHANSALQNVTTAYCNHFIAAGLEARMIDLGHPEGYHELEIELKSGTVLFCFGMQGVGSRLTAGDLILWEAYRTPFVCLHYDNPCHNPYNHFNDSGFVGNIYHFESFLEAKERHLASPQLSISVPYEILGPPPESQIPFTERPIRYMFLKSGAPIKDLADYFDSLPNSISAAIWSEIGRAELDPNLALWDLAAGIFDAQSLDRLGQPKRFWGIVQSMDLYLRQKRAIELVEWLKLRDGAVIVGNGWEFIDRSYARAEFRPSLPAADAVFLYERSQFVFNANPYGRDIVHERNIIGLSWGCCVVSDTNSWWDKRFSDVPAFTRFRWGESLDDQILPALNDPRAEEKKKSARPAALANFTGLNYVARIVEFAAQIEDFGNAKNFNSGAS
jgi:hypothetical protein